MKVDIPDDIARRAQALGVDIRTFVIQSLTAMLAAMERIEKVEQTMQAATNPPRGPGRPPGKTREKRSINLEPRVWAWLESQARPEDKSFSDTCNRVLLEVVESGKKS